MARIIKSGKYYRVVESYRENGNVKQRTLFYLGKEPPWPKSEGWVGLTEQQINKIKRVIAAKKQKTTKKPPPPVGQFRTIVIDPPWPIAWRIRDQRPNQIDLPYQRMTVNEITELPIKKLTATDGCHIYLWTTHTFLPVAFSIFDKWDVKYKALLTWVKNVGFTPYSFMLTTEFVLYGQVGTLPLLKLGKRVDFRAKVREHSRKPDNFFSLVRQVSPEPRLEMFGREQRKGFTVWGNETEKFNRSLVVTK